MWQDIILWENIWLAWHDAALGKRGKLAAATFEFHLAEQLLTLQHELRSQTYRPGDYHHFFIHEPKRRKISAAPFRDRIVHHALCNVIEPHFEQCFITHSYANRVGKGTHRALDYFQTLAQQHRYVLRADIVQHFPSLDHQVLRAQLATVVQDADTLALTDIILNSGAGVLADEYSPVLFPGDDLFALQRPRGLPIGNLTSQFWSNVYMNPFDWFVQRELGCNAYLRYVDDFALFSNSRRQLNEWRAAIVEHLGHMRLVIHEAEAEAKPTVHGSPWLGFVVYPTHRRLKRRNVLKFTRRLSHLLDLYEDGQISFAELDASVQGWIAHVNFADTWGLRTHVFDKHPIPPPKS